ncbi:hypothetical protein HAX54_010722, partial [Datura stramonium]|nr:hypothetical protein [Datura stramonium]
VDWMNNELKEKQGPTTQDLRNRPLMLEAAKNLTHRRPPIQRSVAPSELQVTTSKTQAEAQVWVQSFRPLPKLRLTCTPQFETGEMPV